MIYIKSHNNAINLQSDTEVLQHVYVEILKLKNKIINHILNFK